MVKRKPKAQAFPLTLHRASGQWCKKLRVANRSKPKICYFGKDKDAALQKYLDTKDALQAGRVPSDTPSGPTVAELCNRFLAAKRSLVSSGELSELTWKAYYETCIRVRDFFERERLADSLTVADFERFRSKLAETRKAVSLGNEIQRVKTVFKYGFESDLLSRPMKYGPLFAKPKRKALRRAKNEAGSRMLEPAELRLIIGECSSQLGAMVLLALNAGFGQSDVAALPRSALDLEGGWINFPRPKTEIARRCPLWPETVAALRQAIEDRPTPKLADDVDLVFITKYGYRWRRVLPSDDEKKPGTPIDAVAQEYTKLVTRLGLKRAGSFYGLRSIHRTISEDAADQRASDFLMGHVDESMAERYRDSEKGRPSDARLRAVTETIHEWLFPVIGPQPLAADGK